MTAQKPGANTEATTSEVRRSQILEAVGRIILRGGLGAATFRGIAEEAGVSVRLVQYYFGTREQLLLAMQDHVAKRSTERLIRWAVETDGSPEASLRAILTSFIPTDDESRVAMLTFSSLHNTWLADDSTPEESYAIPRLGEATIADHLRRSELVDGIDVNVEATLLMGLVTGLSMYVLDRTHTPDGAIAALNYRLDRIFA